MCGEGWTPRDPTRSDGRCGPRAPRLFEGDGERAGGLARGQRNDVRRRGTDGRGGHQFVGTTVSWLRGTCDRGAGGVYIGTLIVGGHGLGQEVEHAKA